MSIIKVKQSIAQSKKARAKHSVMNNSGFGVVVSVKPGENRLTVEEQGAITLERAMELHEKGLDISVA